MRARAMRARMTLALPVLTLLMMTFAVPGANAQTNSPSPGQPAGSTPGPAPGGPSNQTGTNVGGDDTAGNRTTPGQGGATGGGAGAPESDTGGGGGGGGAVIGLIVGMLALVGAVIFVAGRQRRLQRVGAT
jgi:uncharacterized membrane protein